MIFIEGTTELVAKNLNLCYFALNLDDDEDHDEDDDDDDEAMWP